MERAGSGVGEVGLSLLKVLWVADPVSPLYISAEELSAEGGVRGDGRQEPQCTPGVPRASWVGIQTISLLAKVARAPSRLCPRAV